MDFKRMQKLAGLKEAGDEFNVEAPPEWGKSGFGAMVSLEYEGGSDYLDYDDFDIFHIDVEDYDEDYLVRYRPVIKLYLTYEQIVELTDLKLEEIDGTGLQYNSWCREVEESIMEDPEPFINIGFENIVKTEYKGNILQSVGIEITDCENVSCESGDEFTFDDVDTEDFLEFVKDAAVNFEVTECTVDGMDEDWTW